VSGEIFDIFGDRGAFWLWAVLGRRWNCRLLMLGIVAAVVRDQANRLWERFDGFCACRGIILICL